MSRKRKKHTIVRVKEIADAIAISPYFVVKFCKANGVPVVEAGVRKIKMIPRDQFFEKLYKEKANEQKQDTFRENIA